MAWWQAWWNSYQRISVHKSSSGQALRWRAEAFSKKMTDSGCPIHKVCISQQLQQQLPVVAAHMLLISQLLNFARVCNYIYICISVCSHWFTRNYLLSLLAVKSHLHSKTWLHGATIRISKRRSRPVDLMRKNDVGCGG